MPTNRSMASANDRPCSPDGRCDRSFTRKTASATCPPDAYIKRVTCPTRQQFYKDLQEQEQTRAEGPRKVYHACSKYKCPRTTRDAEVYSPEVRACELRPRPKKRPPRARDEGDREYEEARKAKLNFVIEKKRFRPPQKHRKGVGLPASSQNKFALEAPQQPATVDEGVQAFSKEATKNSALYNTITREESEQTVQVRESEGAVTRPVETEPRRKSRPSSRKFDGLSEHLKYGLFRRRESCSRSTSRNVFGPATPLDKERKNIGPGLGSDASRTPGRSCLAPSRLKPRQLVTSNVMHVDIKPRAHANTPPPTRKNKPAQRRRRPATACLTRPFISSPAFAPPMYNSNMLRQPTPISYHGSAAIMRVPSNYPQNHRLMPVYCHMTPCPSRFHNVAPMQYYNELPHMNRALRRRRSPFINTSPVRMISRHSKSYDQQLTSPYSRTRSSQSPGIFLRARYPQRAPKVMDSQKTLQPDLHTRSKKSQHSLSSSVRFQNLPSLVVNKVSAINRNVEMSKLPGQLKSQFLRRVRSIPTKRENTTPVLERSPTRRPRTSLRSNQETAANLPSQYSSTPKPRQSVSEVRKRTFNRCLTPTLRRKSLLGENVKSSEKNTSKVATKDELLTPKKSVSATSSTVTSPERHITSISTQTLI